MEDAAMNENKLIRVENLKELGLTAAELSDRVGGRVTYWHGMLTGTRPFGEKAARKIEDALDMRRGAMDEYKGVAPAPAPPYKPSGFALALAVLYDSLPDDDSVRSSAWVNAQQAIEQARGQQNSPSTDVPALSYFPKQRRG